MNLPELLVFVAPLAGLGGAVRAASGHGAVVTAWAAIGGLALGAGFAYVLPLLVNRLLQALSPRYRRSSRDPGAVVLPGVMLLYLLSSPFAAWYLSKVIVSWLLGA